MALTDSFLRKQHGSSRESVVEVADRDGLSVRITKQGRIVFQYRFRWQGRAARLDLGTYPMLSLRQARAELLVRKGQLEHGIDPRTARRRERESQAEVQHTNESLFRLWFDRYCVPNKKGAAEILRSFELHVFPRLGGRPVEETRPHHWLDILEPLAKEKPRIAERVLINAKQCHRWAAARQLSMNQPLADLSAAVDLGVNRHRQAGRALSDDELRIVWRATEYSRMAPRSKLFVQLCLLYGCRPVELREAKLEEFDFDGGVWTIPAERHKTGEKTGRPLIRPILPEFADLLQEAASLSRSPGLLFSSEKQQGAPMAQGVMLDFPYSIMAAARRYFTPLDHFSMYDLRKTARSNWSTLAPPHVCEIMLGHKLPGVWQVYDRHDYLDEQREAYQAWLERIKSILSS